MRELLERSGFKVAAHTTGCPRLVVLGLDEPGDDAADEAAVTARVQSRLAAAGIETIPAGNAPWNLLWVLLYWDCIFSRTEGAEEPPRSGEFPSALQDIPADLFKPGFRERRRELVQARRNELSRRGLAGPLAEALRSRAGRTTRLLEALPSWPPDRLARIAGSLPAEAVLTVLDRIWWDYASNRSAFPDTIVVSPSAGIIEVKGARGTLRAEGIDWLRFMAGAAGLPTALVVSGWAPRKVANVVARLGGPEGELTLVYGQSSSKSFGEVEEAVRTWTGVQRSGEGRSLRVEARLPLRRVGEALPVLETVVRWKSASVTVGGEGVDLTAGSPLRCLAEKESRFEGADFCRRPRYWADEPRKLGCKLFSHPALEGGDLDDLGYRDTERGVYVLDRDKIGQEVRGRAGELAACPHFDAKAVLDAVGDLPAEVNPAADPDWAWIDVDGMQWLCEKGAWINRLGPAPFPGVANMVGVGRVRPEEKRQIRDAYRGAVRFEREQERERRRFDREVDKYSAAPARTGSQAVASTGCGCLLLALGGLVLLVMATL